MKPSQPLQPSQPSQYQRLQEALKSNDAKFKACDTSIFTVKADGGATQKSVTSASERVLQSYGGTGETALLQQVERLRQELVLLEARNAEEGKRRRRRHEIHAALLQAAYEAATRARDEAMAEAEALRSKTEQQAVELDACKAELEKLRWVWEADSCQADALMRTQSLAHEAEMSRLRRVSRIEYDLLVAELAHCDKSAGQPPPRMRPWWAHSGGERGRNVRTNHGDDVAAGGVGGDAGEGGGFGRGSGVGDDRGGADGGGEDAGGGGWESASTLMAELRRWALASDGASSSEPLEDGRDSWLIERLGLLEQAADAASERFKSLERQHMALRRRHQSLLNRLRSENAGPKDDAQEGSGHEVPSLV